MAWYFRKLVVTFQRNLADPHVTMRDALRSAIADVVPVDILAMLQDPKEIATNHWSPSSRLDALTAGLALAFTAGLALDADFPATGVAALAGFLA